MAEDRLHPRRVDLPLECRAPELPQVGHQELVTAEHIQLRNVARRETKQGGNPLGGGWAMPELLAGHAGTAFGVLRGIVGSG